MLQFCIRCVYTSVRGLALPFQKRQPVIIHANNDTFSALNAVHSVLRELVYRDLGSELSDSEFDVIAEFEQKVQTILTKAVV